MTERQILSVQGPLVSEARTTLPLPPAEQPDWEQIARTALTGREAKGTRRLTRRLLKDLCTEMATKGTPLPTAARLHNLDPTTVYGWEQNYPKAWQAIEKARAHGEAICLQKIRNAKQWQASAYLLGIQRPEYRENNAGLNSGGQMINVVLSVPVPQLVPVGQRPVIDITPTQPVDSAAPVAARDNVK